MSYEGTVSPTVSVDVAILKYIVGVGIYDEATDEYVKGTIVIDGVVYPNESTVTSRLEEGNHVFDVVPPTGYEFVRWDVYEYKTGGALIKTSTTRPLTINVTEPIWVWAVIRRTALVETALTIAAPTSVEPSASLTFTGKLTRMDTGAGISGQTVHLEQPPGTKVTSGITDGLGNYSIPVTAPATPGVYQYRVSYVGTVGYGAVVSGTLGVGVGVAVTPPVDLPTIAAAGLAIADVALVAAYLITQTMKVR